MEITSRENATFKNLLKLTDKKGRRAAGLCIIEGEKIVRERGGQIFRRGIDLSNALFNAVSSLENCDVLSVVAIPSPKETTFPYLVLDRIQDAGNMGTLLRTAAAFGFATVFCIDCVDVWSQKVLRASSGVQFNLNIIECTLQDFTVPKASVLLAADLNGSGIKKPNEKFGLVLGSEGQGIHPKIKSLCNQTVTIPMKENCESLNVAVAGGILMYELRGGKQ